MEYFNINYITKEVLNRNKLLSFKKSNSRPLKIIKNLLNYLYTDFLEHFI